ncbi:MAG TPA: hypothetical protein PKG48_08115, partial [Bacteroidales bacterium]|nr:hypothetical protein [Bacteroidales bacterium]
REDRIRELDVRLHEQLDRITDLTSRAAGLEIQLLATENRLDAQTHLTEAVQLKLAAELSEVARLKDLLETSGDRIQSLLQTVSEREQANREMEAELETRQQILLGKERDISDLESHLREGSDQLARAEALIREKESAISALGQQVADLQAVIQERTQRIGELETALLEKVRKVDSLNELLGRRDEEIRRLNNRMQALLTSLSWKITRPLRWSLDILFSIFYLFCPFGSKRWIIVKTLGRVLLHPVKFFREFHAGSLASFFGRLRSPGMEAHRQREQAAREASARPEPPRPPALKNQPGSRPVLPDHTEPEVLVVCFQTGQIPLTPCIRSVSEHSEKPFKFVVTGDLSFRDPEISDLAYLAPGEVAKLLESTSSIRYVMLLHPDVRLMPGTVRTCTETLEAAENRGIVVPQVWNADNMLESAGVVIWNDGCSSHFGTHEGPYDPEHLYLREVDTGDRFAMVKKQIFVWWVAGARYTADPWPFLLYDLSMAARWWGSTVVYQPLARVSVAHSEGFSFPEARETFYRKWQETLENNHLASSPDNLFLARERGQRKTYMLMIDHYVPTFDKDAGSRTMKAYMELFID